MNDVAEKRKIRSKVIEKSRWESDLKMMPVFTNVDFSDADVLAKVVQSFKSRGLHSGV